MREIPETGDRVTADGFRGEGVVEKVHALAFSARVRWPDGELAVLPLNDLRRAETGNGMPGGKVGKKHDRPSIRSANRKHVVRRTDR